MITDGAATAAPPSGRSVALRLAGSDVVRFSRTVRVADIVRFFPSRRPPDDAKGARCAFVVVL